MSVGEIRNYIAALEGASSSQEQEQIELVTKDPARIAEMQDASDTVKIAAVSRFGFVIKFVENPSEAVQLAAVKSNGNAIRYLENPSEAVQIAAVQQNGYAIRQIKNPSDAVKLAVAQNHPALLTEIPNPSKKIVITALLGMIKKQEVDINLFINAKRDNPDWPEWPVIEAGLVGIGVFRQGNTLDIYMESSNLFEETDLNAASEQEQMDAISQHGFWVLKYIDNPSPALQAWATNFSLRWGALQYIKNPTLEAQLNAMRHNPEDIQYIKDPCEEVQLASIANYTGPLQYIDNPTEKVQLTAVKKDWRSIKLIKNVQSKAVVLTAMLKMLKDRQYDPVIYLKFRDRFPDWPEWAALDKSINSSAKQIQESFGMTLAQRQNLSNASEQEQLAAITHDWRNIRYIKNPSETVQLAAVEEHPVAISDINDPTDAVRLAAVKQFGGAINYMGMGPFSKTIVITAALTMLKNEEPQYKTVLRELMDEYPDFPEWSIIAKSLQTTPEEY